MSFITPELSAEILIEKIKKSGATLYSLSEIRDGVQKTVKVTPSSNCHNCYSVAKAFTVTAVGMLFDEEKLNPSDRIYDICGFAFPEKFDERWKNVTLHDLLKHNFGIEEGYLDIDVEDVHSYGTEDYLNFAFRKELPYLPGEHPAYSDAAYYILSRAVAAASGEEMTDYLQTRLFSPLGFREVAWSKCPHGHAMGATGLYISSEDAAKLGQAYLCGGMYDGKRIFSERWAEIVFERGYELNKTGAYKLRESYAKGGMYGQMLWISKKENLVYAWHAHDEDDKIGDVMAELKM